MSDTTRPTPLRLPGRPVELSTRRGGGWPLLLLKQVILLLFSLLAIYPIYYMVITAFKTQENWLHNQFGLPIPFTMQNINQALDQGRLLVWLRNSVVVTVSAIFLSTLVSTLAAYAIARMRFPGRGAYLNAMIILMVIPPAVIILPLFVLMVQIDLVNTQPGLILIYIGMLIPFSVYLLVSFFRGLPVELFDAAAIDGCSNFGILWRIVVPLSSPAFVTLIVVNALWVWNELLIALVFLQSEELKTLMPGLTLFRGHFQVNEPLIMAGTLIATLPMIILYLFGQRFFIEGLVAGAVK
ncbi:MAG TPA: carbohydrate ABC transporter permease [Anaerolineaceae bacterium]|nr:carbohydrate ABC transporter permease [Anaerolineaceae bacterium]